jgi:hypothetical protein
MKVEKLARGIIGAVIVTAAGPKAALACSVCFGDPSAPETKAMKFGIFVLLGFIGSVLAGFGGLFMYWMSRSRRLAQMDEGATQ